MKKETNTICNCSVVFLLVHSIFHYVVADAAVVLAAVVVVVVVVVVVDVVVKKLQISGRHSAYGNWQAL